MDRKGFAPLLVPIIIVALLVVVGGIYYYASRKTASVSPSVTATSSSSVEQASTTTSPTVAATVLNATFTTPYPVQWEYQGVRFAISGVSLDKPTSKLIFRFKITNTNTNNTGAACGQFPADSMRWVSDKAGDMIAPTGGKSYGCSMPPSVTRNNEEAYFDVSSGALPYTFTTGGDSNIFFNVHTLLSGALTIVQTKNPTIAGGGPHWEKSFSFPYPVSWQGWNGATISLVKAELDVPVTSATLTLHFDIQAGGGFCTVSLVSYGLRYASNELGNLVAPRPIPTSDATNCANPNTALLDQKIFFDSIPSSKKQIPIEVFDQDGKENTYFTVNVLGNGTLQIQPAPVQG